MPFVRIFTNATVPSGDTATPLCKEIGDKVAELLQKPPEAVIVCLVPGCTFNKELPFAMVYIMSIGALNASTNAAISKAFIPLMGRLGIAEDKFALEFDDRPGSMVGFKGNTF